MIKYEIKNYQEEFLEAQERIGKEATKEWKGYGQTPAAQLKQRYSQPNFDPETKFYAFDNNEAVGFLTSTIITEGEDAGKRANLEFPLTLQKHEACSEQLFNCAIDSLKKKGIKTVQTRVSDIWLGTTEKAKKWNYKFSRDLYILMEAHPSKLSAPSISEVKVSDFDSPRDFEQMVKIFVEKLQSDDSYARSNLERITQNKETFPIHLVIREDDRIVGRALAYRNHQNPKEFNLGSFYYENENYLEHLLSETINKIKASDAEKVSLFLFGQTLSLEEKYRSIGFSNVGKISYYEKEI